MSDPYLLAASLLTVGPVSAPPPSTLAPNLLDNLSGLLAAAAARTRESAVTHQKMVPLVETSVVEFSKPQATAPRAVTALATNLPMQPKPQSTAFSPTSGTQLYYQRLAALKAGKLYTRLSADSFQSAWTKGTLPKPTHEQWKRLLEQEAKAIAKGQGDNRLAILVGDSLSLWFPSERLPSGQFWLNQGISGENSSQILQRLSAFSQTRPDTIYVMAGTNDLRQGVSDRVILDNTRQILRRLRQNHPQAQVVVQSILPTRLQAIPSDRIRNLNQQIGAIAQQEEAGFLNLHSLFVNEEGQLRRELTTDGIHLAKQGYNVWQEALQYTQSWIALNQSDRSPTALGSNSNVDF
ncbi:MULTISPECIES: GDSL-type esterase/lipase family protein [unclassified Coleofasciculus]|uniref:GDSL-type esterase/lipase family protein n=1 Tax=unclassified Coleofasciculus TaxID=2692782 RepID=UPI00187DFE37|nr:MULTISPECIES: GDSL-type esterase/lipase family protein [unclassified Coleofasciculus]MBE9125825.1 acylhydrolase [Coleofasciculus sp. LEGE 07081]MBE9148990.1 acylhydrolase [Coleofasciculus sp. LEGE 07092]